MGAIWRWIHVLAAGMALALALLLGSGYVALWVWDRTHQPVLPGLKPAAAIPMPSPAQRGA